jgi:hypothetical protein
MMNTKILAALAVGLMAAVASADRIPEGTPVDLVFDQAISSAHAHKGDVVRLHVRHDVVVDGHVVIARGTREEATVAAVSRRGRFGKNGTIKLSLTPIDGTDGHHHPLQPRHKGKEFQGSKTDQAAIASGAGLIVLGPIGLVGGVFITGKDVQLKPGDKLDTEIGH